MNPEGATAALEELSLTEAIASENEALSTLAQLLMQAREDDLFEICGFSNSV